MFEEYVKKLSDNGKKLISDGYFITDVEDTKALDSIRDSFLSFLEKGWGLKTDDLSNIHKIVPLDILNEVRYGFFRHINSPKSEFTTNYLNLAKKSMYDVVGNELAGNRTVNFSIQFPNDESSLLPIHSDMFSGESEFQVNLWIPLVDAFDTNAMFFFNPDFSNKLSRDINKYENTGIDDLLNKNPDEYQFLNVNYGQVLIFTSGCLHGNIINKTNKTRLSLNCRYKNLFSPYNEYEENEKKLGSFYEPVTVKAASIIGFRYNLGK